VLDDFWPAVAELLSFCEGDLKSRAILLILLALAPSVALGRPLKITDPKTLISDSKLVFVGRIKSVKPSKVTTSLSYPAWEGVRFRWLITEVEVLEPFKGVRKGETVRTAMLSVDKNKGDETRYPPMAPGMLEPEKGDIFLLCLAPTPLTNVFAALSAPWDENLSVFALHRNTPSQERSRDSRQRILSRDERFTLILSVADNTGELIPAAVERVRQTYADELRNVPAGRVTYLEWETYTNQSGWMSDAPKGYTTMTNSNTKK